jgi:hypothetical protein
MPHAHLCQVTEFERHNEKIESTFTQNDLELSCERAG